MIYFDINFWTGLLSGEEGVSVSDESGTSTTQAHPIQVDPDPFSAKGGDSDEDLELGE